MNKRIRKPNKDKQGVSSKRRVSSKEVEKCGTNDPQWYASDPSILRDAASIPYSWALGTTIGRGPTGALTDAGIANSVPGICRVSVNPVVGLSVTTDSAINVAATAMYSYVRHANSGHANYESSDLMLYCTGMAQVYAYINWCQRLYAVATAYAQKNRYLPLHLLATMGVNANDIVRNLANFRYWINVFISKATSLAVPATMSYFSRTAFLYSNIYCESDQIKDQLYYFHPASWLKFEFVNETKAGKLARRTLNPVEASKGLTVSEITKFGDELLGAILLDEDMNIMSGDILKAYGADGIIKLATLPESVTLYPVYDELVLEQIHNATIVNCDLGDVEQVAGEGFISGVPSLNVNTHKAMVATSMMNKILSCNKAEPGVDDTIESTRLMVATEASRGTSNTLYLICGSEVATDVSYFWNNANGSISGVGFTSALNQKDVLKATVLKYFKYAPTLYIVNNEITEIVGVFESIDNYAVLTAQDISKMHDAALMNMFAVPSVAKVN